MSSYTIEELIARWKREELTVEELIARWKREELTVEQMIGQMLQVLWEQERRAVAERR